MKPILALITTLCLVLAALAGQASAATRYRVSADTLFVRNFPQSYSIGLLYGSSTAGPNVGGAEAIDIQKKTSDGLYGYGRAHGHFGQWNGYYCGWVAMTYLTNTGNTVSTACPDSSGSILDPTLIFEGGSYENGPYDAVIVSCTYPYVYGNYDPATDSFANRYPTPLPVGRGTLYSPNKYPGVVTSGYSGFVWRYRTKDGHAVLIKDTQSPAGGGIYSVPSWHFVRAECIRRLN
jgi:hypothetical protein